MELERFKPEAHAEGQLHAEHLSRYNFAARYVTGKTVVDVASGAGYGASLLRRHGAASVIGIDRSQEAITHANECYTSEGVTFLCGDVSVLRHTGPTDCIVSFETIEHLDDPDCLLVAARDALAPGGLFIVSTPVRQSGSLSDRPENPYHVREWNEAEFDHLLSRYFDDRKFLYQYGYRRHFYPLSRTLNRVAMNLFFSRRAEDFARFPVVTTAWDFPQSMISRGYMIVLCSRKKGAIVR